EAACRKLRFVLDEELRDAELLAEPRAVEQGRHALAERHRLFVQRQRKQLAIAPQRRRSLCDIRRRDGSLDFVEVVTHPDGATVVHVRERAKWQYSAVNGGFEAGDVVLHWAMVGISERRGVSWLVSWRTGTAR